MFSPLSLDSFSSTVVSTKRSSVEERNEMEDPAIILPEFGRSEGDVMLDFYRGREFDNPTTDHDVARVLNDFREKLQDSKMKVINLSCCQLITDSSLELIQSRFSHLEGLFLYGCINITEKGINQIIGRNPNMTHIGFSGCSKVDGDDVLQSLVDNCDNLETLYATDARIMTIPSNIGGLDKLTELDLRKNIITILPNAIGKLPDDCKISFDGNLLTNTSFSMTRSGSSSFLEPVYPPAIRASFKKEKDTEINNSNSHHKEVNVIDESNIFALIEQGMSSARENMKELQEENRGMKEAMKRLKSECLASKERERNLKEELAKASEQNRRLINVWKSVQINVSSELQRINDYDINKSAD